MDWLIPASELKLATMPRWSWSLATAIARGLWLQEVRIWQSHPGSPRLLLGAREIGRSWWCFDNEDIFFLILFLKIVFWTRSRHCVAWGANAFERTSASMCEPKMQSLVTCCFLVRGQFLLKLWFFMIFHRYFSDLLRSSQLVQFVQKLLRVLDRGWASSRIWWSCCGQRGLVDFVKHQVAVTILWHPVTILDLSFFWRGYQEGTYCN